MISRVIKQGKFIGRVDIATGCMDQIEHINVSFLYKVRSRVLSKYSGEEDILYK